MTARLVPGGFGIESIPQSIAQKVEGEKREAKEESGVEQQLRGDLHAVGPFLDERSPR